MIFIFNSFSERLMCSVSFAPFSGVSEIFELGSFEVSYLYLAHSSSQMPQSLELFNPWSDVRGCRGVVLVPGGNKELFSASWMQCLSPLSEPLG